MAQNAVQNYELVTEEYMEAMKASHDPIEKAKELSDAYQEAIGQLNNLPQRKLQLWKVINRELHNASDPNTEYVSLSKAREQLGVSVDSDTEDGWVKFVKSKRPDLKKSQIGPFPWYQCRINEEAAIDDLKNHWLPGSKSPGKKSLEGTLKFEFEDYSKYVTFGKKVKKIRFAIEFFAKELLNWVFYGGGEVHGVGGSKMTITIEGRGGNTIDNTLKHTADNIENVEFVNKSSDKKGTVKVAKNHLKPNVIRDLFEEDPELEITNIEGYRNYKGIYGQMSEVVDSKSDRVDLSNNKVQLPPPSPFLAKFQSLNYDKQLETLNQITKDLEKSQAGQEFLRMCVETHAPWDAIGSSDEKKRWKANNIEKPDSLAAEDFHKQVGRSMGFDPLALLDEDRAGKQIEWMRWDDTKGKFQPNKTKPPLRKPSTGSSAFESVNGKMMFSGTGKSKAATKLGKRLVVGASRTVGAKASSNGSVPEEAGKTALETAGVVLDRLFTEKMLQTLIEANFDAPKGTPSNVGKKRINKPGISSFGTTSAKETAKEILDPTHYTVSKFMHVAGVVDKFNTFVQEVRKVADEQGDTNFSKAVSKLTNSDDAALKKVAKDLEQNPIWKSFDQSTTNGVAVISVIGSSMEVAHFLFVNDEKWTEIPAYEFYSGVTIMVDLHDSLVDMGMMSRRVISTVTSEVLGFIGDMIDATVSAYQAVELWEVGDDDAAFWKAVNAGFAVIGAIGGFVLTIFSGTMAATIGAVVALAAFVATSLISLGTWWFDVKETLFERWLAHSFFGKEHQNNKVGIDKLPWGFDKRGKPSIDMLGNIQYPKDGLIPSRGKNKSPKPWGRQISMYASLKIGFTVEELWAKTVEPGPSDPAVGMEFTDITNGNSDSEMIICPIGADHEIKPPKCIIPLDGPGAFDPKIGNIGGGANVNPKIAYPKGTIPGYEKTGLYLPESSWKTNHRVLSKTFKWGPPGQIWAWKGGFHDDRIKNSTLEVADYLSAEEGIEYVPRQVGKEQLKDSYKQKTWGWEVIHAPGGLPESVRSKLLNPSELIPSAAVKQAKGRPSETPTNFDDLAQDQQRLNQLAAEIARNLPLPRVRIKGVYEDDKDLYGRDKGWSSVQVPSPK